MFLQLKQDILSGRLLPPPQISVQLSALALQCEGILYKFRILVFHISCYSPKNKNHLSAELGDYDPVIHTPAFVSEFRFVPVQSEDLEVEILECYKHMR